MINFNIVFILTFLYFGDYATLNQETGNIWNFGLFHSNAQNSRDLKQSCQIQRGFIKGSLVDSKTKEPIPFLRVNLLKNDNIIFGTDTDFDGHFTLKAEPGVYDISILGIEYITTYICEVPIDLERITFIMKQEIPSSVNNTDLDKDENSTQRIPYKIPIGCRDGNGTRSGTITREDLEALPKNQTKQ